MTGGYVFDTEAIIAYLYDEPGRETVASFLEDVTAGRVPGSLSETNATEVYYLVARFEGTGDKPTTESLRTADRDIRALERGGLAIERADWQLAGEVKADGQISVADAYAVALAFEQDATLVAGADDDFDELPTDIELHRFREDGV